MCSIEFWSPHICDLAHQIRTRTCYIGDGKFNSTWNALKAQFLRMISPSSYHLSLCCPQLYHHLRTHSNIIPPYLAMPWSLFETRYSKHRVLHTPSTEASQDQLPTTHGQFFISHLSVDLIVLNSLHSHDYKLTNQMSLSCSNASLQIYRLTINHLHVLFDAH